MAAFIGSVLESNVFIDRLYLDTLLNIGERYAFKQDTIIRFRMIIDLLTQNSPEIIKENLKKILQIFSENIELKAIVKQ